MNILITGVSKGLGLVLTKMALENGHNVYGLSRTMTDDLDSLINKFGDNFKWYKIDLLHEYNNLKSTVFKSIADNNVRIDCLINNAAIAYDDIITNLNIDKLEEMFKVNVYAPMMLTKLAIRNMLLHNTKGSIIHVSSISAHTGYKGLAMYASTKGALEAFSKNTAREWGLKGIRSNTVVAGFMNTDMNKSLSDEQKDRIFNRTSLKHAVNIYSVAETILFLMGDGANSITGQNIFVDSGTI